MAELVEEVVDPLADLTEGLRCSMGLLSLVRGCGRRPARRASRAARRTSPGPAPPSAPTAAARSRPGSRLRACSRRRSRSKSTWGSRSILLTTTRSAAANMVGYFERLVVALGHRDDDDPRVLAEVEERRADQVADVLDEDQGAGLRVECAAVTGRPSSASRWQPDPVLTWTARAPARVIRSASTRRLLVALDDGQMTRPPPSSAMVRSSSEVLPAPGRAHQVHRRHPAYGEAGCGRARPGGRSWPAPAPPSRAVSCGSARPHRDLTVLVAVRDALGRETRPRRSPQPQVRHMWLPTSSTRAAARSGDHVHVRAAAAAPGAIRGRRSAPQIRPGTLQARALERACPPRRRRSRTPSPRAPPRTAARPARAPRRPGAPAVRVRDPVDEALGEGELVHGRPGVSTA